MDMSRYLDLFLDESREHLGAAHAIQAELGQQPVEAELWRQFMRHAHSLKGMAASMRYGAVVSLSHALETLAERLEHENAEVIRSFLPLLGESLACLGDQLDRIERGEDAASARAEQLAGALAGVGSGHPTDDDRDPPPDPEPLPDAPRPELRHWRLDLRLDTAAAASASQSVSILTRIRTLGRVIDSTSPRLALETGRFEGKLRLLLASTRSRAELARELQAVLGPEGYDLRPSRLPDPAEPPEVGPPRWVRVRADALDTLAEGLLELRREQARLKGAIPHAAGRVRHHLERIELRIKEQYGALTELRLLPFETVAQRLHQAVHDLAGRQGKQLRFEIVGGDVRLERSTLDALVDPLVHALRNAVDHGLEPPDERQGAGKRPHGTLRLSLHRTGDRVEIRVEDDGRGMQPDLIRRHAVESGVLDPDDAPDLTDEEVLLLTTLPRVTTRRGADDTSGRGVGLDVVRERVEGVGGFVEIHSRPGQGCRLHISVPLRRALVRTLVVRCGGELYAVPVDAVVQCLDRPPRRSADSPAEPGLELRPLRGCLGLPDASPEETGRTRLLVLAGSDRPAALLVDEVVGREDLVVQPLHAPLTQLRQYTGAALLENGSIAVVLDPLRLAEPTGLR